MFRRKSRVRWVNLHTDARRRFKALIRLGGGGELRCVRLGCLLFFAAFSFFNPRLGAATTTFTTSALISETNTAYNGQDIVVSGATLTVDGPHAFNSLLLTNGAVLTHSPCSASQTHSLDLTCSNAVAVSANSSIDVSGRGYAGGRTTGNTNLGASTCLSGGSYGGLGGNGSIGFGTCQGAANSIYGDYADPDDWGSGSADGGPGGGLVRLHAGHLQLEGTILADGQRGPFIFGGGSGGGIFVSVDTLAGSGFIRAGGGQGGGDHATARNGGGGGGGRVAVYARDYGGFNTNRITAPGAFGSPYPGGPGTVYLREVGQTNGLLIIENTVGSGTTPLGVVGTNVFAIDDTVIIRGSGARVVAASSNIAFRFRNLMLKDNAYLQADQPLIVDEELSLDRSGLSCNKLSAAKLLLTSNSVLSTFGPSPELHKLEVTVGDQALLDATSRIDVSGLGYPRAKPGTGAAGCNSGGSYGGRGGNGSVGFGNCPVGIPNTVYGDFADPDDWGSGSANGAPGGGLVRLTAGHLRLDGTITADGQTGPYLFGGGSGGGIFIRVGSLAGTGLIRAAGYAGGSDHSTGNNGGGGGGGRVAVYAGDFTSFDTNRIMAPGGAGAPLPGGPGTVYLLRPRPYNHVKFTLPGRLLLYPTNNYSMLVREPISNALVFSLSKPVDSNAFSAGKLRIEGPAGPVSPNAVRAIEETRYEVSFPGQASQGSYHFALLSTVLDTEGFPLDQNANGIPGEPEDAYTFTLVVDTVPPRVTQHSPAGDVAGTVSSVDLWFSETIDKVTLTPGNVRLTNSLGQTIPVANIQEVGLNRFRLAFASQPTPAMYHLLLSTNILDLAGNGLTPTSPMGGGVAYDASFNLVQVDLVLGSVTVSTNQLWAGDPIIVSWTGRNNTGAPLLGDWVDAVYFSRDDRWDITDVRAGMVTHTGGLTSNEVYSASAAVNVPGLLPGNYHILVRADIANRERETVETNNIVASGPLPLSVRTLASGGTSGLLTPDNRLQYFAIHVAAGQSLRLLLTGGGGVSHLFINFASIPTLLNYDFGGRDNAASQTITLSGVPGGGTYYVLISGEQIGGGGNPFQLSAEMASFYIWSISPNRALRETNTYAPFWRDSLITTVTLNGVGFDGGIAVAFVGSDNLVFPAQRTVDSPTVIRTFVPVASMNPDIYSVRVTKGGEARTLTNAFTVVGDGAHKLEARLIAPGAVSPGGGQTLYVEYANTGTRAMPAPLLKVIAYTNARVQTLSSVSAGSIHSPRPPRYKPVVVNSAQVMALGSGATPGVLQPGDSGRVSVRFLGLSPDRGEGSIRFALGSLTADDTTIQECPPSLSFSARSGYPRSGQRSVGSVAGSSPGCPERLLTVDWNALESSSIPPGVPADGWHAVWQNLAANVGPLWADYVLAMGDNMNHLAGIDQLSNEPGDLFNFEVLQASGALNPVRNLSSAVDASVPSPGFPLVFRRVFAQPILSRYRLGPMGRGWSHNWDISVSVLQNNSAIVRGPLGADRLFTDGAGAEGIFYYISSPGDSGRLVRYFGQFRLTETDGTAWYFNASNRLDYVEDPNANRITCGYTAGRLMSLTHSSGKQLLLDYDGNGRLWHLTDPLGPGAADDRVTTYEYLGEHLDTVTKPGSRITRYTYETAGTPARLHALRSVEFPDLTHNFFDYDQRGRLRETSADGGAQRVTFSYDSAGTVTVQDATGRSTILKYGLGGQLAQVRDGEGRLVNFGYGDTFQLSQLLGPGGERYRYTYGANGNLTDIEDPLRQVNSFAYTNLNRLGRVLDARGHNLRYGYDPRGNLTGITYEDNTSERFAYDARGNVTASTNRRGGVILYTNNAAGQLTAKDYSTTPGITDFAYAYDAAGNLTNATYWNPQLSVFENVSLGYEPATDRLKRIEYPGGRWFEFEYDLAGRRTLRRDQDGHATGYVYDPAGRFDRMTNELGRLIVDYDYDAAGRLSRKVLGNGVSTTNTYNDAGQILRLLNLKPDGSLLSRYEYSYDASGRRDSMTVARGVGFPPVGAGESQTYGYDPLGELTRVEYSTGRVVEYAYDTAGNRTQVTDSGVATPYVPNALNQYSSAGAATFGYDLDGNLTNKTEAAAFTLYAYDIENRLIGVTTPTDSWSYTYDAFGNRVATTHNGQTMRYVVDPTGLGNVVAEYDGGGSLLARYEHGFGLLARTDAAGNPGFYTFSAVGHTSELTDPSGAVANAYAYDPFGLSLAKAETVPNPFEFVGEFGVMNEGNGLEFMRARFYETGNGRFLSRDPIGIKGGLNLYACARNRPSELFDPRGLADDSPFTDYLRNLGDLQRNKREAFDTYEDNPQRKEEAEKKAAQNRDLIDRDKWRAAVELWFKFGNWWSQPDKLKDGYDTLKDLKDYFDVLPIDWPFKEEWAWLVNFVRSRDPNDKLAPGGYGTAGFLAVGGVMPYQIRFENVTNASAPAQRVTVTDTLDPNLDLSTFELTEIAFANQLISIPAGLSRYSTRISLMVTNGTLTPGPDLNSISGTPCPSCLVAEVEAELDFQTRELRFVLTALDPATGWLPEDPLTGLLYPNDSTGRGAGSISFLVRPSGGLPSGTQIRNRAHIVFDYNDPIDTPLVLNTLDAGPPSSSVLPLPALSGRTFVITWSGADEPGGSGVATFDVYGVEDGTNNFLLLQNTTETSTLFTGAPGHSYAFYSMAHDNVGNEETAPSFADAQSSVSTNAPVLNTIPNSAVNVGQSFVITNILLNGIPVGSFVFSLGPGAPAGASINSTNGILRWTPNCSQASRTNTITVRVTDTGNTNIYDLATFTVGVGECVSPQLGRLVLRAGDSGRVPVNLISSVALTNLSMTVETLAGRLTNFIIEAIVPEICSATITTTTNVSPLPPGGGDGEFHALTLGACVDQFLIGTQQVAWLDFTAVSNQSSAFVPLLLDNTVGRQLDGSEVRNFAPQAGRVVVVSQEPLLEAYLNTNRQPEVLLYGLPGRSFAVQTTTNLDAPVAWRSLAQVTMTNLWQPVPGLAETNRMSFFRAVATGHLFDRLNLTFDATNQTALLVVIAAQPAHTLVLEASRDLVNWTPLATNAPVTTTNWLFLDAVASGLNHRFYRVKEGQP